MSWSLFCFTCKLVSLGLCCITTSYVKAMPIPKKRFIPFRPTPFLLLSVETRAVTSVCAVLHANLRGCLFLSVGLFFFFLLLLK